MHELMAATLETVIGEIREHPGERAEEWIFQTPDLADDRHAHA